MTTTKAQLEHFIEQQQTHIERLEGIIADLRTDREIFTKQIENLQDALIAIKSPEAYHDMRMDRLGMPDQLSPEERAEAKQRTEIEQRWLRELEEDTFKSPDDIIDGLSRIVAVEGIKSSSSLHGNSES